MSTAAKSRVTVVSGGTDGMGRALVLARLARGDQVIAIGRNPDKARALAAEAGAPDRLEFIQADLSSVAATRRLIDAIRARRPVVDALALFANGLTPKRVVTAEGLERTFALYYLSRYLLGHGLREHLERSANPVIINVAGVGVTRGSVHWQDLQLARRYSMMDAQLQAGRANDLLGVDSAARIRAHYVLYHPGFTRSGDLSQVPRPLRIAIRAAARVSARPVADAIRPIVDWIDHPPAASLTAMDRDRAVPLQTPTLDPADARRLATATKDIVNRVGHLDSAP